VEAEYKPNSQRLFEPFQPEAGAPGKEEAEYKPNSQRLFEPFQPEAGTPAIPMLDI